ncbi:MAG: TIM barrel protein [Chloroflexi bacterium]|nr:TIM barrel protein [Chloroflexota bacterium]
MRFAANLSLMFPEVDQLARFKAAAEAGFTHVEMLFPFHFDLDAIERELKSNGQTMILFDTDAGDFAGGERGYLCDPAQKERFHQSVKDALAIAPRLGTTLLNALAGKIPQGVSVDEARKTVVENLKRAAPLCEDAGVTLMSEGLNTVQTPGYFLDTSKLGFAIVDEVGSPAVKFQYDIYHMQIMEGNLIDTIRNNVDKIGHFQVADNPGRHEPGSGEINYANVLKAIDESGYKGYVALEYVPAGETVAGLDAWLPRERRGNR